jgi:hypothetical protein
MMFSDIEEAWNSPLHKQLKKMQSTHNDQMNKDKMIPPWDPKSNAVVSDVNYDQDSNFYSVQGDYVPLDFYKGDPKFMKQEDMDPNGFYRGELKEYNPVTHKSRIIDEPEGSCGDKNDRKGTPISQLKQTKQPRQEGFCHNINSAVPDDADKEYLKNIRELDSCLENDKIVQNDLFYQDPDPKCDKGKNCKKSKTDIKENFETDSNCDKALRHIKSCKKCRDKLKMETSHSWFTQEIKELLIFILIGIFIIFILDIFVRLGRNFPRN